MNIFTIPSWYPTASHPIVGIFVKEQVQLLAEARQDWKIGVSLWGSHEPALWLKAKSPFESVLRLSSKKPMKQYIRQLGTNCIELFHPSFTWTRRIDDGNITGIIGANRKNLERFKAHYGNVDIIHAHVAYPAGAIAHALSKEYRIPFVTTEHMSPFPLPSFKNDFRKTLLPSLKGAYSVMAVSNSLKKELAGFGIDSVVIPNMVDIKGFKPGPSKNETPTILAVGRLETQKGFDLLIIAMYKLADKPWKLEIVGDGGQKKRLAKLIKGLGLENRIILRECLSRQDTHERIKNCDFFVLSSRHESFGMAATEAMACGKPIVYTKCGGATEEFNGNIGLACDVDADSLKVSIEEMLRRYANFDRHQIRQFVVDRYSVTPVSRQLEKIYQEAINDFRKV